MKVIVACVVALVLLCGVLLWNLTPLADASIGGIFFAPAAYDHSAADDPILHPGEPGAAHLHDFFGPPGVDAFTQPADLGGVPAFWTPALLVDGVKIQPRLAQASYNTDGKDPSTVQPFPFGLVMIAGGEGSRQIDWGCQPTGGNPYRIDVTTLTCGPNNETVGRVSFPDCWNGTTLDSDDHRSHMAYSVGGVCPPSHPVPVLHMALRVMFGILPAGTVTLSSGATNTWHADAMYGWNRSTLEGLVRDCIRARVNCGRV